VVFPATWILEYVGYWLRATIEGEGVMALPWNRKSIRDLQVMLKLILKIRIGVNIRTRFPIVFVHSSSIGVIPRVILHM
jgi:hypothetical protein